MEEEEDADEEVVEDVDEEDDEGNLGFNAALEDEECDCRGRTPVVVDPSFNSLRFEAGWSDDGGMGIDALGVDVELVRDPRLYSSDEDESSSRCRLFTERPSTLFDS